jgi:hypothetical protein
VFSLLVTPQEERYVPVSIAKSAIERMVTDIEAMKARHQEVVASMDAQYQKIEQQTQRHYLDFIQELKVIDGR